MSGRILCLLCLRKLVCVAIRKAKNNQNIKNASNLTVENIENGKLSNKLKRNKSNGDFVNKDVESCNNVEDIVKNDDKKISGIDDDEFNEDPNAYARAKIYNLIFVWGTLEIILIGLALFCKSSRDYPENFLKKFKSNYGKYPLIERSMKYKLISSVLLIFGAKTVSFFLFLINCLQIFYISSITYH